MIDKLSRLKAKKRDKWNLWVGLDLDGEMLSLLGYLVRQRLLAEHRVRRDDAADEVQLVDEILGRWNLIDRHTN